VTSTKEFKVKFASTENLPERTQKERDYKDRATKLPARILALLSKDKMIFSHIDEEGFDVYTK
jgi:hypothetical protein